MENKQTATERTVDGSRKNPAFPKDRGSRIHYTYTRRTGHCPHPDHKLRASSRFVGVNEYGWIFDCRYDEHATHYFTNWPAGHEA